MRQLISLIVLGSMGFSSPAQSHRARNPLAAVEELSSSVQELASRAAPSVVQVFVTRYGPRESGDGARDGVVVSQQGAGSGVIIDSGGYIVTNAHVVAGARSIKVRLASNLEDSASGDEPVSAALAEPLSQPLEATVVGAFQEGDLALLKIPRSGLPALTFADYRKLRQGQIVLAFGSREGLTNSLSMGVVSSVARQQDPDSPFTYIQTDASINPGDSGGPLLNTAGEIVGLNTFIVTQGGGSEGLGFAIPSPLIRVVCDQLRTQGHFDRVRIGVGVQTITPTLASALTLPRNSGVLISDILPERPADVAGLRLKDIVLSVDGAPTANIPTFMMALLLHPRSTLVSLRILRDAHVLAVNAAAMEEDEAPHRRPELIDPERDRVQGLGIIGVGLNSGNRANFPPLRITAGVFVAGLIDAFPERATGLRAGDVIHRVNDSEIGDLESLRHAAKSLNHGDPVALLVERESALLYLSFDMP